MATPSAFVAHVLDLMAGWGGVSVRRMFGGYGLYRRGVHFALIADDTLYFKVDARNRADFEAAGTRPFVYSRKSEAITLSYWEAPSDLFDDPDSMVRWAQRALEAALAARQTRPPAKSRKR